MRRELKAQLHSQPQEKAWSSESHEERIESEPCLHQATVTMWESHEERIESEAHIYGVEVFDALESHEERIERCSKLKLPVNQSSVESHEERIESSLILRHQLPSAIL